MLKESSPKLEILKECLRPLGLLYCNPLFEGYTLSIENMVFGMRVYGEFYLRICPGCQEYIEANHPATLEINRKGRKIPLNYYHIDQCLWDDQEKLLYLSSLSLNAVNDEKKKKNQEKQLKDLANITYSLRNLLIQAEISDVATLFSLGSRGSWLKLQQVNKNVTLKTLYALEGAIQGRHASVLPLAVRKELQLWFNEIGQKATEKRNY